MKILDRYLLREYLLPVTYCFSAFSLMYVVFHLFNELPDFIEAGTPVSQIATFYFHYLFTINGNAPFIVLVLPISLLLGSLYALARLTRTNELIAMRASGMSLLRLMVPFLAVGLVCSFAAAVLQETVAPSSTRWTWRFQKSLSKKQKEPRSTVIRNFPYYNSSLHRHWVMHTFDPQNPYILEGVKVTQERPDGGRVEELYGDEAFWLDGRWWFKDLRVQKYRPNGDPDGALSPPVQRPVEMIELTESPIDFLNEIRDWEQLSSREMVRSIQAHPDMSPENRARKMVDLQNRLAMPWTCVVVALLGIPAGARTGRQGIMAGVMLAIGFFFCFYALVHFGVFLGKRLVLWPWLAAWLPNIVFSGWGSIMLWRMR